MPKKSPNGCGGSRKSSAFTIPASPTTRQEAAWKLLDSVKIFSKTANLGDVRSTITHPWTTTHGKMQPEAKYAAGIREGLLRISVGLEHADDLIADLAQAMA